jgi:hypothetical protein
MKSSVSGAFKWELHNHVGGNNQVKLLAEEQGVLFQTKGFSSGMTKSLGTVWGHNKTKPTTRAGFI